MLIEFSQSLHATSRQGFYEIPFKGSGLIDFLRVTHQLCRTKPKLDFIRACDILKAREEAALSAYVETLVRGLPAALQSATNFHNPGCSELSFDEAWLTRVIQTHINQDESSLAFLVRSRVKCDARSHLLYIIEKLSLCLP